MKLTHLTSLWIVGVFADVPVSCPYSSTLGTWEFQVGTSGSSQDLVAECGLYNLGEVSQTKKFLLQEKDLVTDLDTGIQGTYTIVSTNGFEIYISGRRYWAYYYFDSEFPKNNDCGRTAVGYQRDNGMKSWNCIQGTKISGEVPNPDDPTPGPVNQDRKYLRDFTFINKINAYAKTWKAKHYEFLEEKTLGDIQNMHGGHHADILESKKYIKAKPISATEDPKVEQARNLKFPSGVPRNWDWRNVNGLNYDSPVWDQQSCGSCFAFASKSVMESRVRVHSNLTMAPIFSAQEMITCGADNNYNQGCSGGFAYLVAGKEMYEQGFVDENCDPSTLEYNYKSTECPSESISSCQRWYASDYQYLGGFYGASTVDMMLEELYNNGPISVGIYAPNDFHSYEKGIYYQTGVSSEWNPINPTNHAVVVVGYGRCPDPVVIPNDTCSMGDDNLPYWIVKNSWGPAWGMSGYVSILMGVDEIAVESKPFIATPVLPL